MTSSDTSAPDGGVSVVMVSYHTGNVLFAAIDSVLGQAGLSELIVVDNGNPDAVTQAIADRALAEPRLVLLAGHGNIGFARACNLGARRATGGHLLLLNPDCELMPGALAALADEGGRLRRPWLIGPRMVGTDGEEQRGSRRALLTPQSAAVEMFRLDRLWPRLGRLNQHEMPASDVTRPVPAISGAAMFLPLGDYRAAGGMDEGYFLHVEDLDFCFRFRAGGGEIFHVPAVTVLHHLSTSKAPRLAVEWHKAKGFRRYFRKNFGGRRYRALTVLIELGILTRFAFKAVASILAAPRARGS